MRGQGKRRGNSFGKPGKFGVCPEGGRIVCEPGPLCRPALEKAEQAVACFIA